MARAKTVIKSPQEWADLFAGKSTDQIIALVKADIHTIMLERDIENIANAVVAVYSRGVNLGH